MTTLTLCFYFAYWDYNTLSNNTQAKLSQLQDEILMLPHALRVSYGKKILERHAPELLGWLSKITGTASAPSPEKSVGEPLSAITIKQPVAFDPELARLAYTSGLFTLFRMWVYSHRVIGDGSGWVKKEDVFTTLNGVGFHLTRRHFNRQIQRGNGVFWTLDNATARIYLTGYENLSVSLVARSIASQDATLETNRPGRQRIIADLSGNLEDAVANAFGAWCCSKDKGNGVTISRTLLSDLWNVSLPTLLSWEAAVGITKTANYAQSHDTSIENIPAHAYLCKSETGEEFVSWRLPNTYYAPAEIQEHPHVGNTRKARESVNAEIDNAVQPDTNRSGLEESSSSNVGSLRTGKIYFDDEKRCSKHLLNHQDVFTNHYFYIGSRKKTKLFERYDVVGNYQQTELDRDFKGEKDFFFRQRRRSHHIALEGGQNV